MTFLRPDDHELMRLVRARIAQKVRFSDIAIELGVDHDELTNWLWEYKLPTAPKPYQSKTGTALAVVTSSHPDVSNFSRSKQAQRFANWRRAQAAAAEARRAMGDASK